MAFDPSVVVNANKAIKTISADTVSTDLTDFPLTLIDPPQAFFDELKVGQFVYADTDPIAHWTMDNVSGSTLVDEIGDYDGTISNMVQTADGKFEKYLAGGDPSSNIRMVGMGTSRVPFKTISMWVKRDNVAKNGNIIYNNNTANRVLYMGATTGELQINNSVEAVLFDLTITDDSTWHHVVLIEGSSSNYHKVWLDGVESSGEVLSNFGGEFTHIGRPTTTAGGWIPNFDNVQVYDYVLTDDEIEQLYQSDDRKKFSVEVDDTQCPVEIELNSWDGTNGKAVLHAKIPVTAISDTDVVLAFDKTQGDNDTYVGFTGDTAAQDVWDSNFVFVSHQAEDPSGTAPQIVDSTSYEKDGTSYGTMTSADLIDGDVGKMIAYDGVDDYINHGYDAAHDITDTLTLEAIIAPASTISGSLSTNEGLISRTHDGSTDSYKMLLHTSGVLQIGPVGGYIRGTKTAWTADQVYVIAGTYNATGLTGKLFVDGVEETLTADSYDTMAGGVIDLAVATEQVSSGYMFNGSIGEIRISDVVRSDDWIELTHLSLTDQLGAWTTISTLDGLLAILEQDYEIVYNELIQLLSQQYDIVDDLLAALLQSYSLRMLLTFLQSYGDVAEMYAKLDQYYWDAYVLVKKLAQPYKGAEALFATLQQKWKGAPLLMKALQQYYILTNTPVHKALQQQYDFDALDVHTLKLIQIFSLLSQEALPTELNTVTIINVEIDKDTGLPPTRPDDPDNPPDPEDPIQPGDLIPIPGMPLETSVGVVGIGIEFSSTSYCGTCTLNITDYSAWEAIEYERPLIVTHGSDTYEFIIIDTNKTESARSKTYTVEAKSKAILLDFPYADKLDEDADDMVYGKASEIVNRLAAIKNQTVVWEMVSDPIQTSATYSVSGKSPLEAIRGLVNELGGSLQSDPDGTLRANPWYINDTDKLDAAEVVRSFASATDYTTVNTDNSRRSGYNIFEILNEEGSGYQMTSEEITPSHFEIRAYKVPWSNAEISLRTSELTNVSIVYDDVIEKEIKEELVEIKVGIGNTELPILNVSDVSFETRIKLGETLEDIGWTEEGVITTTEKAESMLNITYTTRYHKWDVHGTDAEKIQLILETV